MKRKKYQIVGDIDYDIPPHLTRVRYTSKGLQSYYEMLIKGSFDKIDQFGSSAAHRLFHKLMDDMKPFSGNKLYVHFGSIAKDLGLSSKQVYHLFKFFLNADLIRKVKKGHYLIDPSIAWCGSTAERLHALKQWHEGLME